MRQRKWLAFGGLGVLAFLGLVASFAQDANQTEPASVVEHPECSWFTPKREAESRIRVNPGRGLSHGGFSVSKLTEGVTSRLASATGGQRAQSFEDRASLGTIDRFLLADMDAAGVARAAKTTDAEYLRRASLDLTGRIPTLDRVASFLADRFTDKRSRLADDLLNSPEWVDKWTMFFGDLYQNTDIKVSVNLRRFAPGRNAFWKWTKDSLAANKPYDQMARELITATGNNSWTQGELNWVIGGWVINRPVQDNWDQQAANVAETFLGVGHMNCILCHNGRSKLDELSLWGSTATRSEAYGLAAFLARTNMARTSPFLDANGRVNNNVYYWNLVDNPRQADYALNTITGNRPERIPIGSMRNVPPVYPFNGRGPRSGENYRDALAREVTTDVQFARATVNYMWKAFFGIGLVEPVNQFDPARLDPDNPPPAPWTLQPSNARLLNALAQEFIGSKYNLKALMKQIVMSEAYQLSSRYDGQWNPSWDKLFARKLVRRLWAEEIHDAIAQSSGVLPSYNIADFSSHPANSLFAAYPTYGNVSFALQFPEVRNMPNAQFLDPFVRGDRDGEERQSEGSLLQALNLMNDVYVTSRVRNNAATSLIRQSLALSNEQAVDRLFLTVLSRYPTDDEKAKALAALQSNRTTQMENLLHSLYNKVDFVFNY